MSDLIISATRLKDTKRFFKLQIVEEGAGPVGIIYVPKSLELPEQITIKVV